MRFPKLIKDDNFCKTKRGTKLYRYKLDWVEMESISKEKKQDWYNMFLCNLDVYKKDIFHNKILEACNWSEYHRPTKYDYIYDMFEYVYMSDDYYNEIKHLEKLAISEWNRQRGFDTSVRDNCLRVAIECVNTYFYMILDAHYIYTSKFINTKPANSDKTLYNLYKCREEMMLGPLYKYRFWKNQTGGGLVIGRSFGSILESSIIEYPFYGQLFSDLTSNLNFNLLGLYKENNIDYILRLILNYIRVDNIDKLLK